MAWVIVPSSESMAAPTQTIRATAAAIASEQRIGRSGRASHWRMARRREMGRFIVCLGCFLTRWQGDKVTR